MFPDIVLLVRQIDVERLGGVKPVLRRQPEAVADADALLLGRVGRQHEALGRRHIVIPPGPEPDLRNATAIDGALRVVARSEEHTSELQSLMRISYAVFCLKKKQKR